MARSIVEVLSVVAIVTFILASAGNGRPTQQDPQAPAALSLAELEPDHHRYSEAERCANCHELGGDILRRAVGVDVSSGTPEVTGRGWLSSVHARSQSHEDRVDTACAWCHAPTTPGATQDEASGVPIERGTWQGVTCGACHPVGLDESLEESLVTNLIPGSNRAAPASFTFIDRSDPKQLNAQCQFCHHEYHDLVASKAELMDSGALRCIDCHMAGYAVAESGLVERFHNFKVEANGPQSCNGAYGTGTTCHADASTEWMGDEIPTIKGPRKKW